MSRFLSLDDVVRLIGKDELLQVAGQGSHNAPDGRFLDEAQIGGHIAFTDELIGGYLNLRYPHVDGIEIGDMPEVIKGFGSDIVRYRLRARSGDRNTVTEEVRLRYEDAMKWLKQVGEGKVHIPFGDAALAETSEVALTGEVRGSNPPSRSEPLLRDWRS